MIIKTIINNKIMSGDFLVNKGDRIPINSARVLLAGTARDVATYVEKEVTRLYSCLSGFKEVFCLIVESDSGDETVSKLKELKSILRNFEFVSLGPLSKTMPTRTERLAFCRNRIVHELRVDPRLALIDYVVLADLDGVNAELSAAKIAQCWTVNELWDVVTANQAAIYFDIRALRHPDWCPDDCWELKSRLDPILGDSQSLNLSLLARQVKLSPEGGLIEVESAFGGFAIYRKPAFLAGEYCGLGSDLREICEHVPFHRQLRLSGYHIYINCALINCLDYGDPYGLVSNKRTFRMCLRS